MPPQSFANSYILTTRDQPKATSKSQTLPLPNGALWWYTAPKQYDPEVADYTAVGLQPSAGPPPAFLTMLESDLQIAIANGFPQLTVVIHGLANLFSTSVGELASVGSGLQQYAQYYGLMISFDWPSYDTIDSFWPPNYGPLPYNFTEYHERHDPRQHQRLCGGLWHDPSDARSTAAEGWCRGERDLPFRGQLHDDARNARPARRSADNSEPGAARRRRHQQRRSAAVTHHAVGYRQGAAIATLSQQVTIYYSSGDDVLPWSKNFLAGYHNPSYRDRLGLDGPSSYANLLLRTGGVDCSSVINDAAIQLIPQVPPGTSAHSSYFYIPQVLQDWAQTLAGTAPANVINRVPVAGTGNAFTMRRVPPPAMVSIR